MFVTCQTTMLKSNKTGLSYQKRPDSQLLYHYYAKRFLKLMLCHTKGQWDCSVHTNVICYSVILWLLPYWCIMHNKYNSIHINK